MNNWHKISDGLPPLGVPLIVTIEQNEYYMNKELRYPVYYSENKKGSGYAWYWYYGDFCYELMPNVSEVIAWQELPKTYIEEQERSDDLLTR